jgi:hypothetical protein
MDLNTSANRDMQKALARMTHTTPSPVPDPSPDLPDPETFTTRQKAVYASFNGAVDPQLPFKDDASITKFFKEDEDWINRAVAMTQYLWEATENATTYWKFVKALLGTLLDSSYASGKVLGRKG